jgi:hypothetical protein
MIEPAKGRPSVIKGRRVNTYLDEASLNTARALGNGKISEGIRKALKLAKLAIPTKGKHK